MATTVVLVWGNGANPEHAFFRKTPDAEGWWRELALRDFWNHSEAFWIKAFVLPLPDSQAIRRVSPEAQADPSVEGWRVFCGEVINREPPPSNITQDGRWVVNGLTLPADYVPFWPGLLRDARYCRRAGSCRLLSSLPACILTAGTPFARSRRRTSPCSTTCLASARAIPAASPVGTPRAATTMPVAWTRESLLTAAAARSAGRGTSPH
jgi:hypothetical protein